MPQEMPIQSARLSEQTQDPRESLHEKECQVAAQLPPEVFVVVFQYLSVFQLKQVRVTCHRWKSIVDGSSVLLRKFCLNLPKNAILDHTSEPACLIPVPHVSISNARIISLEPWRQVLGENLTQLCMFNSKFSLAMLAGVLRRTPNLKELDLFCNHYPTKVDVSLFANFQLDRMIRLKLHDHFGKLFQMLRRICPQLQHLDCDSDDMEQDIIEYLLTIHSSLKSICIMASDPILETMTNLPSLRLKRAILTCGLTTFEKLLRFIQAQSTLESLGLRIAEVDSSALCEIGRNLPNLRSFSIELFSANSTDPTIWRPTFLASMPRLKQLSINALFTCTTLKAYRSPNLEELELCGLHFESSDGLGRYLRHSPNLRKLVLQNFSTVAESDLFGNLPLTKLHTLRLISVKCCDKDECIVEKLENLRNLELNNADISRSLMSALLQLSPRLECVRICEMPFDDNLLLEMCRSLKLLKMLSLQYCPITDVSVYQIIAHCHVLEQLEVSTCFNLSNDAKLRLEATGRYHMKDILDYSGPVE